MILNFNPRSPWGERHSAGLNDLTKDSISIHALREESDLYKYYGDCQLYWISIHALREESDLSKVFKGLFITVISIHALREESDRAGRAYINLII